MKKFLFLLMLLTQLTVVAQDHFVLRVQGGLSLSYLKHDNLTFEDFFSTRSGLLVGGELEYAMDRKSHLVAGLHYELKGSGYNFAVPDPATGTNFGSEGTLGLGYLVVPVLYRFKFGNGKLRFFLNTGPYVGFLLHSTDSDPNLDDFKSTDLGLSYGFGFRIPFKDTHAIALEIRLNTGFTDISRVNIYDEGSMQTVSWNFILGYEFRL